ncbi:MAG: hypothetical protein LBQ28_08855, partial [Prevotellaceae bacterium]|nr:hypothetical protein [Prevotellaceae bacterium]
MKKMCENINKKTAEIFGSSEYFANTHTHTHTHTIARPIFTRVNISKISLYSNSFQTPNLKYFESNITKQIFFYTYTKPSSIYDGFRYFLTYPAYQACVPDIPSRAADAPSRAADAPSRAADAPSRAAVAPTRAADAPSRAAVAPARVAVAPARVAVAPARTAVAPARVADAPFRVADAPTRVAVAPARAAVAPARVAVAPAHAPTRFLTSGKWLYRFQRYKRLAITHSLRNERERVFVFL